MSFDILYTVHFNLITIVLNTHVSVNVLNMDMAVTRLFFNEARHLIKKMAMGLGAA